MWKLTKKSKKKVCKQISRINHFNEEFTSTCKRFDKFIKLEPLLFPNKKNLSSFYIFMVTKFLLFLLMTLTYYHHYNYYIYIVF